MTTVMMKMTAIGMESSIASICRSWLSSLRAKRSIAFAMPHTLNAMTPAPAMISVS